MLRTRPSPSPIAPSDWTRTRRELLFAAIIRGSCATGDLGPLIVPGFVFVAADIHVSLTSVTLLKGSLIMVLWVSAYVCSPVANCFGRRPVDLFTTLLSYSSLIASCVFQAGTSSNNEVLHVHERGLRVGLWNFAVIVSVNLTPIISGYIIPERRLPGIAGVQPGSRKPKNAKTGIVESSRDFEI
ncbi:uncharacterized protein BO72DRAFT_473978 [Aspergillus fijiensis CBS 313.89]|uniref:MFS general substrate transporter n=1 Tax=Aspergillus fijiensis CBS 313.89 TaxID=1448319 RepID=A0A8G1S0P4_9EURO|nr:uncharacterized protein BO72DRAFT_473978 [Aspergillus fijiensis CBS 313.89]RAK82242.1 hypothetical protein BO72DRAFT_473978 [Aspergillus fijiensis CBS 313.89]